MTPLDAMLISALLATAFGGFVLMHFHSSRRLLIVNPCFGDLLVRQGLTKPEDFLALSGVIISGHPDRHVARLTLGDGEHAVAAFLKREHRVPWRDRLWHAWLGSGFVSKSMHEARILRELQQAGINCPEWIAAGEDTHDRAFLLVRALDRAVDLRIFLRDILSSSPAERLRFAHRLGEALAQVHDAGFDHPDLHANHVFVDPKNAKIWFIDWQRSRRRQMLGWRLRRKDITVLHATLADKLARSRERVVFLGAYLRATLPIRIPRPFFAEAIQRIQWGAERLLRHRHIREVRRPALAAGAQNLIWLEGEALCVTREFRSELPDSPAAWLAALVYGQKLARSFSQTDIVTPSGRRAVLTRRRSQRILSWLWHRLRGRRITSAELERAGLLFRLQRYGVVTPRLLAVGQRTLRFPWQLDSFLLTEVVPGGTSVAHWFQSLPQPELGERRRVIREVGIILRLIHDAGCSLDNESPENCPLQVQLLPGKVGRVVVSSMAGIRKRRGSIAALHQELATLQDRVAPPASSRTDQLRFFLAYLGLQRLTPAAKREANKIARGFATRPCSAVPLPDLRLPRLVGKEAA